MEQEQVTQKAPQPETRPGVDINAVVIALAESEKYVHARIYELEQRLRTLEAARDREFECELSRRLSLADGTKGIGEGAESPLSQLRRRVRAL